MSPSVVDVLGRVGLPMPADELASRTWDVTVVGGGHNGLVCSAYLARAGLSVLVLEARDHLGGACTLERPFSDDRYVVSPCAYLLGLLDERVISELELRRRGLAYVVADPEIWTPFDDGTAFAQWVDDSKTNASLDELQVSQRDREGYFAYQRLFRDIRLRLRQGRRDSWIGASPNRGEIEEMLGHDRWMIDVVFNASVAEVLDQYLGDERLKAALYGGGIIGTYAGPKDSGTAAVKLMHRMGDLDGKGAVWAYVRGGMGMVSFLIAEAAREAGVALAAGVPVAQVLPGEGVVLEDGMRVLSRCVVSNADPKVLYRLLPADAVPAAMGARLEEWDVRSATVKFNAALSALPHFAAARGENYMTLGTVDLTGTVEAAQDAFERCTHGAAAVNFAEVYFQTGHDPSVAPEGHHLVSMFCQYAPYDLDGGWDARRESVARQILDLLDRFAPGASAAVEAYEVLGPPDIEQRHGLTGGHIFQGSVLPEQMWERRLAPRTEIPGVYLCGAATHPGGSVIGLNGRNAAASVLEDLGSGVPGLSA
jgi:phytoene dehydrogenase-like protein